MASGRVPACGRMRAARCLRRALVTGLVALTLFPLAARRSPLAAQTPDQRIRTQREELDRIRRERENLERRAAELRSSVHDLNEEVTNLDSRADATARLVKALDTQLATISDEVDDASSRVSRAETDLAEKRGALKRRLVDIYKRGPTYTTQALLSAHSFGELVARYKYLHLLALRDRTLVSRVEQLRDQVAVDRDRLVTLQTQLAENRADKQQEEERLRALEHERAGNLAAAKRQSQQTEERLTRVKAAEAQLTNVIASLEADRRRAESARPSAPRNTSTIKTSDYGKLDWPVDGPLLYTYGKAQTASNTTIRWDGVGIKATVGTPVRSVAPGRVASVGQLGTYGLTVIVDHGGGDYSIYASLARASVRAGDAVVKGQAVGTVGISDPDQPPHLHFEIRHAGPGGQPRSVDPASWLRGER
jgi:septal ring factor EnvC (AmiA/AmiB activator)